jgi:glycosidase
MGQAGWWQNRTFYEVFVRSFADSNGDGVGDLQGLIGRLDYLRSVDSDHANDLGVDGLWLMPTFPSPSYHGYDVTDYEGVQPDYGSIDDLKELVREAHRRGIAVILDLPLNHTSDQHPWFVASKAGLDDKADWYVWSDQPQGNGWQASGDRYYYANFGPDLPDLNLRNPDVTAELTADADFWIGAVGVDGFRLDAAKHLIEDGATTENTPETHAWLRTFTDAIHAKRPDTLLLGEVWDAPKVSASYVPGDLDLTFDFTLSTAYVMAAQSGDGASLMQLMTNITKLYPGSGGFASFLSNHDMDRVASQLHSDPGQLGVAAELLLFGPGVPFVYYGEEIGMTGAKPDERIRTPMRWDSTSPAAGFSSHDPWEALSDDPSSVSVAGEMRVNGSLLEHYRALIEFRHMHPALSVGTWTPVASDQPSVVAALRVASTETALVVTNLSTKPVSPTLSLASGPLCGRPEVFGAWGQSIHAPPASTATGGFDGYRPVAMLPPQSTLVILLGS